MEGIDAFIAEHGIDAPEEEVVSVDWQSTPEPTEIDLAATGITTVIYATGFHFDFGWIDLPVFDGRVYPRYRRGITDLPGLYFVGLHWMHTQGSGLFYGVGRDAEYVIGSLDRTSANAFWIASAHSTASTTDGNSTSAPSPISLTSRPPRSAITGSNTSTRCALSAASVPVSSSFMSDE